MKDNRLYVVAYRGRNHVIYGESGEDGVLQYIEPMSMRRAMRMAKGMWSYDSFRKMVHPNIYKLVLVKDTRRRVGG